MDVPGRYFRDAKPAFLRLIDPRGLRVLDLGCGGGHNGEMLKKAGAREVVGVERDPGAAAQARERLDRVVECDLAALDPAELGEQPFDAILASDVLEHLLDAEGVLARAVTKLRPGGAVVLSLPNVSNVYVFSQLLRKTWPRRGFGHLRPYSRALVRQARHGAAAERGGARGAARGAVLHPLPGDQGGGARALALRLPGLLGAAVPAAGGQAGRRRDKLDEEAGRHDGIRPAAPARPRERQGRTPHCWTARASW